MNPDLAAELAADLRERRTGIVADLLDEFGREIQGVAYLVLRDHADAEEVLMDTLVTAWRRSSELREDRALRVWLLRIATRLSLTRIRRRKVAQPIDPDLALPAPRSTQPSADRLIVAEAMDQLPAQMRAAVALHHIAGLTVSQAATAMGKSENTVKSQLREGLARLRSALHEPRFSAEHGRRHAHARRA